MAKPKKRKIIKKAVKAMGKKKILKNAKRKNFSVKKIRPKKQKQKIKTGVGIPRFPSGLGATAVVW